MIEHGTLLSSLICVVCTVWKHTSALHMHNPCIVGNPSHIVMDLGPQTTSDITPSPHPRNKKNTSKLDYMKVCRMFPTKGVLPGNVL